MPDPEVPVLTIDDLGVLRDVTVDDDGHVRVDITPTYSGCPAMDAIRADVAAAAGRRGAPRRRGAAGARPGLDHRLDERSGRRKLADYGIAPPSGAAPGARSRCRSALRRVRCPQCGSPDTRELSRFGSTACKSLWRCQACREPFDHFKAF